MLEQGPSRTATIVAVGRGLHRLRHPAPWVFDDPYALSLVGPGWAQVEELVGGLLPPEVDPQATAALLVRARYAEDRLLSRGLRQYVILGAGLDSFAWRRPDVLASVTVFEVDHPASQAYKCARADELALPGHDNHRFVPCDFETQTLAEALDGARFDWHTPTLFSWLGVTMYLSVEAIEATLRTVAKCGKGSEIVFSYGRPAGDRDAIGDAFAAIFEPIAAASGEPIQSWFTADEVEALVSRCGLTVAEHPTHHELHTRYCADRTDGITPISTEAVISAGI